MRIIRTTLSASFNKLGLTITPVKETLYASHSAAPSLNLQEKGKAMRVLRTALSTALLLAAYAALAQTATGINYNATNPAAPAGTLNVNWQHDGSTPIVNASAYVTYPTIQVTCPLSGDLSAPIGNAFAALNSSNGGIVDARGCTNATSWTTAVTISNPDTTILLPCATLTATQTLTVAAGTRNTTIHGCAYQGTSNASSTAGGTIWNYTGSTLALQIGDATFAADTAGFALSDLAIVTASGGSGAEAIQLDRVQEADLERLYILGNNAIGQAGIVLNGTGNYTGGTFQSIHISGYGAGLTLNGNSGGAANASTFIRLHIDCPVTGGTPITGGIGVLIAYGDGNTFTGGDWESCDTMLSLGAGATDNTFTGVRNENSDSQIIASSGSSYNLWLAGGTLFTGKLSDAGTHNTFWDAFHRGLNNLNGDIWRSQADTTVTNHIYLGTGVGHVRGRIDEYLSDTLSSPYTPQATWSWGASDGDGTPQYFGLVDMLNNVPRFYAEQQNTTGGNNQTDINSAGTGAIILNGSANAGTGGIVIDSGGASPTQVANFDTSGDLNLLGYTALYNSSTLEWYLGLSSGTTFEIHNAAATAPANIFRAFINAGTEIDSQGTSAVVVNNASTTSGTGGFIVYEGGANATVKLFSVTGTIASPAYDFPGIAAASGHYCLQVDNSGYMTNTSAACGSGGAGTVTSVGLAMPADLTVSNSPVTGSGTLTATWANESQGYFHAGPATGGAGTPLWRVIAATDLPANITSTVNNVTVTAPSSAATLTLANGSTLQTTGAFAINLTATAASTPTFQNGAGTVPYLSGTNNWTFPQSFTQAITSTRSPTASYYGLEMSGTVFTGGTGTTTFPMMGFIQGGTAETAWSTSGTELGMNAASGFAGNFLDFHVNNAASAFSVSATGSTQTASITVATARRGTFVCTAAGTITITNANYVTGSDVIITMYTAGGTITTPPAFKTVTSGTGFAVLCGATDTSTYQYSILN